jgi:Protein of unknown function (DUF3014)
MNELSDLRLDKSEVAAPETTRRRGLWILIIVVLVAIAAAAGYVGWKRVAGRRAAAPPAQQTAPAGPSVGVAERDVVADNIALPPLDQTDSLVRELVSKLSSHPTVAAWLTTDQLIRNFTVSVVNVSEGHAPAKQLGAVAPKGAFKVSGDNGGTIADASYDRYDPLADAFAGLDGRGAARLYLTLKPRIQEAYRELGYPEGDFDQALTRAINELLRTPAIDQPVSVHRKPVLYVYDDPQLESLSAAQKQLLRTGPRNVRLVQARLREIAQHLALPIEGSPETSRPGAR